MRVLILAEFEGGGGFEVGLREDAFAVRGGREFDACAHFVSFFLDFAGGLIICG